MIAAELFDVASNVAIVTGGAAGIGLACAREMADNGAHVVLIDRDEHGPAEAIARLAADGGSVSGIALDVADRDRLRAAVTSIGDRFGRIDIVFATAGVAPTHGFLSMDGAQNPEHSFENIKDTDWDRVIAINRSSVVATIQAAIPFMKQAATGRIIVTSSVAALRARPMVAIAHPMTKAAVAHLVKQAALELACYGITVNAMLQGPFATRLMTPAVHAYAQRSNPMHRAAATDEIQGLALYLASPSSSFVTGAHIVIYGGQSLGEAD